LKRRILCTALPFLLLFSLLCGCGRSFAEKASRSYNIVVNAVNETDMTMFAIEAEIRYNGINSGNRVLGRSDKKRLEFGESFNFVYEQEDLPLGTSFDLKFYIIGANNIGTGCRGLISLDAEYGEVYYVRLTGNGPATLTAELYTPEK